MRPTFRRKRFGPYLSVVSLWISNLGSSICFSDHLRYLLYLSEIVEGYKKAVFSMLCGGFLEEEKMFERAPCKEMFSKRLMSKRKLTTEF